MNWRVELGDCLEVLERLPAESVDAVVTDPPYGLEFMGEDWDRPWAVGFRQLGHDGAEGRLAPPQFGSSRNPMCRACRKHKRGSDRCACDAPDFDETPAHAMRAFQAWSERWAAACLRVLKPGGHLLAFGGTRTYHRLACAVEDAGFEIRDRMLTLNGHTLGPELDWLYGSGWPKSRNIGKAIDKRAGVERQVVGAGAWAGRESDADYGRVNDDAWEGGAARVATAPATPEAAEWEGWGTALKPAHEPIVVARKPFRGPVEEQVLATGTGALNIDACRIDARGETITAGLSDPANRRGVVGQSLQAPSDLERNQQAQRESIDRANALGRWPANVVLLHAPGCERVGTRRVPTGVTVRRNQDPEDLDGGHIFTKRKAAGEDVTYGDGDGLETIEAWACTPDCPVAQLDAQSGDAGASAPVVGSEPSRSGGVAGVTYSAPSDRTGQAGPFYGDQGGASRFFYSGKASPAEREAGLERLPLDVGGGHLGQGAEHRMGRDADEGAGTRLRPLVRNVHPTVKPIDLMRWLVRLVTPPGGVVLDPFTGSGTTGCAAALEGLDFIGIERDERFHPIAEARIAFWAGYPAGTATDAVLDEMGRTRRAADEAVARRAELASAGQLDLLAGGED